MQNDEIKEKIKAYYVANDIDEIIDYITNLQQENQELNDSITWWNNRFNAVQRNYEELKQENEIIINELKLQKGATRLFKNDLANVMGNFMETELDAYEKQEKELQDYKSRKEKAVEYIKINFVEDIITVKTLLNILNGRSDE